MIKRVQAGRTPARHLRPGSVIDWNDGLWLVTSQSPAQTLPRPQCKGKCEPRLVRLVHLREDRWLQTHECIFMIFDENEEVVVNDSVRVQVPKRTGRFLDERERVAALR